MKRRYIHQRIQGMYIWPEDYITYGDAPGADNLCGWVEIADQDGIPIGISERHRMVKKFITMYDQYGNCETFDVLDFHFYDVFRPLQRPDQQEQLPCPLQDE